MGQCAFEDVRVLKRDRRRTPHKKYMRKNIIFSERSNREGVIKILKYFIRCLFKIYIFKISKEIWWSIGKLLTWGCEVHVQPKGVSKIRPISETGRANILKGTIMCVYGIDVKLILIRLVRVISIFSCLIHLHRCTVLREHYILIKTIRV